ncbi:hypothetical protein NDU88_003761 [Pleurodeles waltl]|uniref:Uncharacterized protein n=1 Tax=Pleurodeles waltl TaxID=8319 RepID=A0AAV7M6B4_PLEWA|nr:hypothetical protein NDU88_003761 [Pleurodeles waltl]
MDQRPLKPQGTALHLEGPRTPEDSGSVPQRLQLCNKEATLKQDAFPAGRVRLGTLRPTSPARLVENNHFRQDSPVTARREVYKREVKRNDKGFWDLLKFLCVQSAFWSDD